MRFYNRLLFLSLFWTLFSINSVKADDALGTFTMSIDCADFDVCGQSCVSVVGGCFTNIFTMELSFVWDPDVLNFVEVIPGELDFISNANFNQFGPGRLVLVWFDQNASTGVTEDDGAVLFEMCFETSPTATTGATTDISFAPNIASSNTLEIVDVNGEIDNLILNDCEGLTLTSGPLCASATSCPGAPGSFTIFTSGGTAPYNISWAGPASGNSTISIDGGSDTQTVPNGSYTITITDDTGVVETIDIDVTTDELTCVIVPDIDCVSSNTVSVFGTITAGNLPVGYIITNTELDTFPVGSGFIVNNDEKLLVYNLPSGIYEIELTDANGCVKTEALIIPEKTYELELIIDPASCDGVPDGGVQVIPTGGNPGPNGSYYFTWVDPIFGDQDEISDTLIWENLTPGIYELIVWDRPSASSCNDTFLIEIPSDSGIQYDIINLTNPDCPNEMNGGWEIMPNVDGDPSGNYIININDINGVNLDNGTVSGPGTFVSQGIFGAGTYLLEIAVQTPNGVCFLDPPDTLVLVDPIPMTGIDTFFFTSCNVATAELTMSGGTIDPASDYDYTWTHVNTGTTLPFTGNIATGLDWGTYDVLVTDDNGCEYFAEIIIPIIQNPPITGVIVTAPECFDTLGAVAQIVTDGDVFETIWGTGGVGTIEDSITISGIQPGDYSVFYRGTNNCPSGVFSFTVDPFDLAIIEDVIETEPMCNGGDDGQIAIVISGGETPYEFTWSTDPNTTNQNSVLPGLTAGIYTVTVADQSNCDPFVLEVELGEPDPISISFDNIVPVNCGSASNGAATAMGSGGTVAANYNYFWESGGTNAAETGLSAGYHTVTVTDDNSCSMVDSVLIEVPNPLDLVIVDLVPPSCPGTADGSLFVNASGGSPVYTFDWGFANGPSVPGLTSGWYFVTITDAVLCTHVDSVELIDPSALTAQIDIDNTVNSTCNGANDGQLFVTYDGGTGLPSFIWDGPDNYTHDEQAALNLAPGLYEITVEDESGCTDSVSFTITEPEMVTGMLPQPMVPLCFGDLTDVIILDPQGGTGSEYFFQVNNGALISTDSVAQLPADDYTVVIVDSLGCESDVIMLTITNPPQLSIDAGPDTILDLGEQNYMIDASIASDAPLAGILWSPAEGLSCTDCEDPSVTTFVTQLYTVVVTDINGCTSEDEVLITINNDREVYIPNIFTPNEDGINDLFQVFTGNGITSINYMRVFDRWGGLVFERNDVMPSTVGTEGWDGTRKNVDMPPGVYVYVIEVSFADGVDIVYSGDVSIIR